MQGDPQYRYPNKILASFDPTNGSFAAGIFNADYFDTPVPPSGSFGKVKIGDTFVSIIAKSVKVGGTLAPVTGVNIKIGGSFVDII